MSVASTSNLQPLGIGELLDRAVRLYRKHFFAFIGIFAVMQIPIAVVQLFLSLGQLTAPGNPRDVSLTEAFTGIGTIVMSILTFVLVSGFATAATTRVVSDSYLGESISIQSAYRKIGSAWRRLLGASIVAGLVSILLLIWFIIPCVGWLTGLGILFFYSTAVTPLIGPTVVLEGQAGTGAIRRAWDLTRRRFWRVVGFMIILVIFSIVLVSGPALLVTLALQAVLGNPLITELSMSIMVIQTLINSLTSLMFNLIYMPFELICTTLLYFDLRSRKRITPQFDYPQISQMNADLFCENLRQSVQSAD